MKPEEVRASFRDLLAVLLADRGLGQASRARALTIAKNLQAAFEDAESVRDTIDVDDPRYKRGYEDAIDQVVNWHVSEFDRLEEASKGHADRSTKLVIATKLTTHKAAAEFIRAIGSTEDNNFERVVP